MTKHRLYREGRRTRRHQRRGYTLMEVVTAAALFIMSVGLLAGAVTTTLAARMMLTRAAAVDAALDRLVQTTATAGWENLVRGTFDPPSVCDGYPNGAGTLAKSCVTVNNRRYEITWEVTADVSVSAIDGVPSGAADSLTLKASTSRSDGSTASRSRTLSSPTPGYRINPGTSVADGVVRVQLSGSWSTLDSPVLLLQGPAYTTVLAAARPDPESGTVVLRSPAGNCTAAVPCRIGLGQGGTRGLTATHSLDGASTLGPTGSVTLTSGRATYATARVYRRGTADLYVQAVNTTSGRRVATPGDAAPQAGSVCIWLSFSDGYAAQLTPRCNTANGGASIPLDTYVANSTAAIADQVTLALPANETISVLSDSPATSCPAVPGQVYHDGSNWVAVGNTGVCSTWTWGRPSTLALLNKTTTTFPNATVTLTSGDNITGEITWTEADRSRPAAGAVGVAQPVWSQPRTAALCPGWPGACSPTWLGNDSATSPEQTACATTNCKSTAGAPYISSVTPTGGSLQRWPYTIVAAQGSTKTFTVIPVDPDGQTVSVQVADTSSLGGTLAWCTTGCVTAAVNQTLATVASGATTSWSVTLSGSGSTVRSVTFRLTDSAGKIRLETVQFAANATDAVAMRGYAVTARQKATTTANAAAWTTTGAVSSGTTLSWTQPQGSTLPAGTTQSDGRSAATWSPANTAAGVGSMTARTPAGQIVSVPWTILQAPSTMSAVAGQGVQGGTVVVRASVLDAAGTPIVGLPVALSAEDGSSPTTASEPAQGVVVSPAWCITTTGGSCVSSASIGVDAQGPTWRLKARAGSASAIGTASITRKLARIIATDTLVTTGQSSTMKVQAVDGGGHALEGVRIAVAAPVGMTLSSATLITDVDGYATLGFSVLAAAPVGTSVITATSAGVTAQLPVTIQAAAASLSLPSAVVQVNRGATLRLDITALGAQGSPAIGALLTTAGGSDGLNVTPTVSTGADGHAIVTLYAESSASAVSHIVTIASPGTTPLSVAVVVR